MIDLRRPLLSRLLAVFLAVQSNLSSAVTLPFAPDSFQHIQQQHRRKPFLLVFWSIDCPPCVKELEVLAAASRQHPDLQLVLVSTDEAELLPKVEQTLQQHGLQEVRSWIFASGDTGRLRRQIDPAWYGELPRSYFYDQEGRGVPLTGGITRQHIDAWLARVRQ